MSIVIKEIIVKTVIEQGKPIEFELNYQKIKQAIANEVEKQLKQRKIQKER